jgi:type IV secretory pathway VirB3-like protein
VYAIEFAMVFLIFFAVLYGAICYGMLFAFRLGVQNAAEDGARAALRYQPRCRRERMWRRRSQRRASTGCLPQSRATRRPRFAEWSATSAVRPRAGRRGRRGARWL